MVDRLVSLDRSKDKGEMALSCKECRHAWIESFDLPMPMDAWLKRIGKMGCPACQAPNKKLSIHFGEAAKKIAAALAG